MPPEQDEEPEEREDLGVPRLRRVGPSPLIALRALSGSVPHAEPASGLVTKATHSAPWLRVRDGKEWALAPWRERPDPASRGRAQMNVFFVRFVRFALFVTLLFLALTLPFSLE